MKDRIPAVTKMVIYFGTPVIVDLTQSNSPIF